MPKNASTVHLVSGSLLGYYLAHRQVSASWQTTESRSQTQGTSRGRGRVGFKRTHFPTQTGLGLAVIQSPRKSILTRRQAPKGLREQT